MSALWKLPLAQTKSRYGLALVADNYNNIYISGCVLCEIRVEKWTRKTMLII
jgi:hypothetical protein